MQALRNILHAIAWIVLIALGAMLGVASAHVAINAARGAGYESVGPNGAWRYRAVGAETGYARAAARANAPAPLSDAEMRLFIRDTDDDGAALREDCVYELSGRALPTRWWSATIYHRDGASLDNGDNAKHVRSDRLNGGPGANRSWRVRVAPVRGDALHWLSSRGAGTFAIGVRAYHPLRDYREVRSALPSLQRVSCAGAKP